MTSDTSRLKAWRLEAWKFVGFEAGCLANCSIEKEMKEELT